MIRPMKAGFLAVGSELLGVDRVDTNSLRATTLLERFGAEMCRKVVVGDSVSAISRELLSMTESFDLVIVSGGLGPTADDVTREATAKAFGLEQILDPAIVEDIAEKFRRMGRTMAEVNQRQALVPRGAQILDNPRGTAPGLRLERGQSTVFLLPGVPRELEGLMRSYIEPWLEERAGGAGRETRVLKVACVPESELEQQIHPAYGEFGRESITILAKPAEISVRMVATGPREERRQQLDVMSARLRDLIGAAVYSDQDEPLEAVVGRILTTSEATVATAESCTGGLVAERLTRVAGSSAYFEGAMVTYSNRLKMKLLGVEGETLDRHGAVSEEVARAMASGVRQRLAVTWGLGITGVAGPGGGSEEKPVGTVHVAVAGPAGVHHRRLQLPGDRERIRVQSSQIVLEMLRRALLRQGKERAESS